MLKVDIHYDEKEKKTACKIHVAGPAMDIIAETAELVKKIRESLDESDIAVGATYTYKIAVIAAALDMDFKDIAEPVSKTLNKKEGK